MKPRIIHKRSITGSMKENYEQDVGVFGPPGAGDQTQFPAGQFIILHFGQQGIIDIQPQCTPRTIGSNMVLACALVDLVAEFPGVQCDPPAGSMPVDSKKSGTRHFKCIKIFVINCRLFKEACIAVGILVRPFHRARRLPHPPVSSHNVYLTKIENRKPAVDKLVDNCLRIFLSN